MGGYGSGRQRERRLITDYRCLDIRWINKQGWFEDKGEKRVSWKRNGKPLGSIRLLTEEDCIRLIYKWKRNDGPWESQDFSIRYLKSPCHFGGVRYWFECPVCHRQVCKLYLAGTWCCRKCGNLAYPVENMDQLDRLQHKSEKLEKTLGRQYQIKPKGMHWKTYGRLLNEYFETRERIDKGFRERLEKTFGNLPFGKT